VVAFHEIEKEDIEQHNVDPQEMSACIKCLREFEKGESRKKFKATKTSMDPITLMEGDLYDIGDIFSDVTMKALEQFEKKQQIFLGAI